MPDEARGSPAPGRHMRTGVEGEREAADPSEGRARSLDEFAQHLRSVETEQRLFEVAARRVTTLLGLEGAAILLYDALADRVRLVARAGRIGSAHRPERHHG